MRRQIWFIAAVGALVGLQTPLCALACLATQPAAYSHAVPSCHEQSPDSAPAGAPISHEDCGCELVTDALVPRPGESTFPPAQITAPPPLWRQIPARVGWQPRSARITDLPPPDILLLKSTLLI